VTTVYVNGDEMTERHKTLIKSLTDMEIIFFDRLKFLEAKIDTMHEVASVSSRAGASFAEDAGDLDKMIDMVEHILNEQEREGRDRASR
jgi:hypothetical protein